MKTLILADIHHKTAVASSIFQREKANVSRVITTGDHMDDFGDNHYMASQTAKWMKNRLTDGWDILIGNHDLPYGWHRPAFMCPGWTRNKAAVVVNELSQKDWYAMKFWVWAGSHLVSHAGFNSYWINQLVVDDLAETQKRFNTLHENVVTDLQTGFEPSVLWWASACRGGSWAQAGVLWADWSEHNPVNGLNQIVGHTPAQIPRQKMSYGGATSYCIDTHMRHYAIVDEETNQMTILETNSGNVWSFTK